MSIFYCIFWLVRSGTFVFVFLKAYKYFCKHSVLWNWHYSQIPTVIIFSVSMNTFLFTWEKASFHKKVSVSGFYFKHFSTMVGELCIFMSHQLAVGSLLSFSFHLLSRMLYLVPRTKTKATWYPNVNLFTEVNGSLLIRIWMLKIEGFRCQEIPESRCSVYKRIDEQRIYEGKFVRR